MNWGKGIVIGLASFMTFVIVLVVMMFKSSDDSYDKDYYEQGLNYDEVYEQRKNVLDDEAAPKIKLEEGAVRIEFAAVDSGKVLFYRPSDDRLDETYAVEGKVLLVPVNNLSKGEWRLIAEWNSGAKGYRYEENIFIE
ncbi:nitrogen fixation protein FixH [Pseudoxanthomonas sp. SGD-10]|nr:nitrogen fixation protein FixH [Pseudoxanthomonas sp. SGD-10]